MVDFPASYVSLPEYTPNDPNLMWTPYNFMAGQPTPPNVPPQK